MNDRCRQLATICFSCLMLAACVGSQKPVLEPTAATNVQASGVEHFNEGDYRLALDRFNEALHEHRLLDDTTGIVISCINIARTLHAAGNDSMARDWLQQARTHIPSTPLAERNRLEENLNLLSAEIALSSGDFDKALQQLSSIDDSQNSQIISFAARLKTEIAFAQQQSMSEALTQYEKTVATHAAGSISHRARLSRFKAALETNTSRRDKLYQESVDGYRELGKVKAIATTLQEWAAVETDPSLKQQRLLRALYIRADSRDVKNVSAILDQLGQLGGQERERTTAYWIKQLEQPDFELWRNLMLEFDQYPR